MLSIAQSGYAQDTPPAAASANAQTPNIQSPQAAIPDANSSAAQLETQGDKLRGDKRYLDALDYYDAALKKQPSAMLWNKAGMSYLLMQKRDKASKCFDHAIKLRPDDAVFHYNMASSYFSNHDYPKAAQEYKTAFSLDPDIFRRVSRIGVMVQASSPEDRAAFSFLVAKLYAEAGDVDHSLEYLRKAMEDGYKDIKRVYTDTEFATLRTDKRFEELMAQRPQAIQ